MEVNYEKLQPRMSVNQLRLHKPLRELRPHELEIFKLMGLGYSDKEIARALGKTYAYVKNNICFAKSKLGLPRREQIAVWAAFNLHGAKSEMEVFVEERG